MIPVEDRETPIEKRPVPITKRGPPSAYACEPPEAPPLPTKQLAAVNHELVLDDASCIAGAVASGGVDDGRWNLHVTTRDRTSCTFDLASTLEDRDQIDRCTWEITQPRSIALPRGKGPLPPVAGCTRVRSRDLRGRSPVWERRPVPGALFSITLAASASRSRSQVRTTAIPAGTRYRLGYQLFEDRQHTRPSTIAGAKGELDVRYGLGEVGQGIEQVLDLAVARDLVGDWIDVTLRHEIAQGLREKVALAPYAELCVTLSILEVTPPAAPRAIPTTCAATEEWMCQVGPTSVDRTSAARGCGCGHRSCADGDVRWTTEAGGTWPDGARKLRYECLDRQEWIRRTRALRKP